MLSRTKIACLPVGEGWEPSLRSRFENVIRRCPVVLKPRKPP